MNRSVGIATTVGIVVIIAVIIFQVNETMWEQVSVEEYKEKGGKVPGVVYPENPQILGPLQINKDKYLLGENVFMKVSGIPMGLKDNLLVYSPGGKRYLSLDFDGDKQDYMKYYFRPSLLRQFDMCDKKDVIGKWTINFAGTPNDKIYFQIMDEILPKSEEYYVDCNEARSGDAFLPIIEPFPPPFLICSVNKGITRQSNCLIISAL